MSRKLIMANWKVHPLTPHEAVRMAKEIERGVSGIKNAEVTIAPPHPFLLPVGRTLKKAKLGAQDLFWEKTGPYTGEVSPGQLKRLGVTYVIIGHSERRALGETDEMINKKIKAALKAGLIPVLAVGEQKKMTNKKMRGVLTRQLAKDLAGISAKAFKKGVVAYEPVWAIGTGLSAKPEHAKQALAIIRETLQRLWKTRYVSTRILYGGSVNSKNAASFVSKKAGGMDGMLVGGASLKPKEFTGIIKAVAHAE